MNFDYTELKCSDEFEFLKMYCNIQYRAGTGVDPNSS
jgi:hypothetical protein